MLAGPAALRVLPDVVREPDLFVVPPEEVSEARGAPLRVRPALVVEVTSPPTRSMDLREKAVEYQEAGIPAYWVIDAEQREVVVQRLEGSAVVVERLQGGKLLSRTVPGFWLEVDWLCQEPLPPVAACLEQILSGA